METTLTDARPCRVTEIATAENGWYVAVLCDDGETAVPAWRRLARRSTMTPEQRKFDRAAFRTRLRDQRQHDIGGDGLTLMREYDAVAALDDTPVNLDVPVDDLLAHEARITSRCEALEEALKRLGKAQHVASVELADVSLALLMRDIAVLACEATTRLGAQYNELSVQLDRIGREIRGRNRNAVTAAEDLITAERAYLAAPSTELLDDVLAK